MIPSKTEEELKQLAREIHAGHVFTDRHVQDPNMLASVFMIFMFLDDERKRELMADPPGMIYEHLSEAGPRSVNGLPSFLSVKMLNREDTDKVIGYVKKLQEASDNL